MHFRFGLTVFTVLFFALLLQKGTCLKCFSCNSKTDNHCNDPFFTNHTGPTTKISDCPDEISTREFIDYFSNLMYLLGVPVNLASEHTAKIKDVRNPSACQKVEIDDAGKHVTIRECALFSDILCDSLRNDNAEVSILYCDVCNKDYCNSCFKYFPQWYLLIGIALINFIIIQ